MQLNDRVEFTLSRDNGSNPQDIIAKKTEDTTDTALITEMREFHEPFPVGTTVIPMGAIGQGRWVYIKPTADVAMLTNGGTEQLTFRGGKASRFWMNFTSMSLVVSGAANVIHLVIAGE